VSLGFSQGTAQYLASRCASSAVSADGPDRGDAIGELLGVVAGGVKLLLSTQVIMVTRSSGLHGLRG
jgi:hypothetical protein